MDQLTRFAQRLVEQLGTSREGVHRPVEVAALRETVLPYRTHRRALGTESVEDYETILVRLISGERGYVKTLPPQAAERCREELAHANPDLAVLDEVGSATVQITSMVAAEVMGDSREEKSPTEGKKAKSVVSVESVGEDKKPVPRKSVEPVPSVEPVTSVKSAESVPSVGKVPSSCPHCQHEIPGGRQVVFCPWCGQRLIPFTCARCNTELDSRWKHCITCGAPVKDPFAYS